MRPIRPLILPYSAIAYLRSAMAISLETKLAWFDRGAAAFERTFPGVLRECVGDDAPRYVCPLCNEPFGREAVLSGDLTAEHVPPLSFGGRELLLTCRSCNNTAGTQVDAHARRREDVIEASDGTSKQSLKVRVGIPGVPKLQALLESSESGAQRVQIIAANNNPAHLAALKATGVIKAGTPLEIELRGDDRYAELSANMSWFRSGFLALFAVGGYKYSLDPAFNIVQDQLRTPDKRLIYSFTINIPKTENWNNWKFVDLAEPRCTAVMFGKYVLLYPFEGDIEFYQRLEQKVRAQEAGAPRTTTTGVPYELVGWEPRFGYPIPPTPVAPEGLGETPAERPTQPGQSSADGRIKLDD